MLLLPSPPYRLSQLGTRGLRETGQNVPRSPASLSTEGHAPPRPGRQRCSQRAVWMKQFSSSEGWGRGHRSTFPRPRVGHWPALPLLEGVEGFLGTGERKEDGLPCVSCICPPSRHMSPMFVTPSAPLPLSANKWHLPHPHLPTPRTSRRSVPSVSVLPFSAIANVRK